MSDTKIKPCYTVTHKKLYYVWHTMKKRCNNPNNSNYKNYGGRGITYCDEWESSDNFCKWALENGYEEGLELDRIDVNGNYEPCNCRWVDRKTNCQNKRNTVYLEVDGCKQCVSEWERILGLGKSEISSWIERFGKNFAKERIKEILNTGDYQKYKKDGVKMREVTIYPILFDYIIKNYGSISNFSKKVGVAHTTISLLLQGKRQVQKNIIDKILNETGMCYEKCFCGTTDFKCKPMERIVEQLKENSLTKCNWDECVDLNEAIEIVQKVGAE